MIMFLAIVIIVDHILLPSAKSPSHKGLLDYVAGELLFGVANFIENNAFVVDKGVNSGIHLDSNH